MAEDEKTSKPITLVLTPAVIGLVSTLISNWLTGTYDVRDRVKTIEVKEEWLRADIKSIQTSLAAQAIDISDILHQPNNKRGLDNLLNKFKYGTATLDQLYTLRTGMLEIGKDTKLDEGLRVAAMQMVRAIEVRIESMPKQEAK